MPVPTPDGDGAYCFGAEAVDCPAPECAAIEIADPFGNVIGRNCAVNPAAQPPTACARAAPAETSVFSLLVCVCVFTRLFGSPDSA